MMIHIDNHQNAPYMGGFTETHVGDNDMVSRRVPDAWFCVQSLPNQELTAFNEISEASFKAHFPRLAVRRQRYGKTETLIRPFFPTYLFASFSLDDPRWPEICRLRGVRRIFMSPGGIPRAIRAAEVERLMALGRAGDGVIDDEAVPFAPGQAIRITGGPLKDITGICQWSDTQRVGFLMTMFGADKVVRVPLALVEAI